MFWDTSRSHKNMIIIKLKGGLGNQFFQYAFGKNLSKITGSELKIDISNFKNNKRTFLLDKFNTDFKIALEKEIEKFIPKNKLKRFIKKKVNNILPFSKKNYYIEKEDNFNKKIFNLNPNSYIEGYWQNEKYFYNIKKTLQKELTLKNNNLQHIYKNYKELKENESVSIHIRRGDYLEKKYAEKYINLNTNYYKQAIKLITKKNKNPYFFIFSDDIDWCKKNLNIANCFYIDQTLQLKDYEELILMSKCKHNIIANSTFSWWAAWLNKNPNKIIIAPQKWKINEKTNLNLKEWIQI